MNTQLNRTLMASAISLLLVVPASATIMIDDFSSGNDSQGITSGSAYFWQNGSMLGGTRGEYLTVTSGSGASFDVNVNSGVMGLSKGTGVSGDAQIAWGYVPGNPFSTNDLNLDLSGESKFDITVENNNQAGNLSVFVMSNGTSDAVNHAMPVINSSTDMFFNFSEFSGIDWASVDQIAVIVATSTGGDTVLDTVKTVPEPATLFALGTLAATIATRRNRTH